MKPARVLLIEDDNAMAELIVSDLQLEGYDVRRAADGEAGLEQADTWKPALIILDVMLPKKNGYDVCRHLRKNGFRHPIVMLTAKSQDAEKILGLDMGADDYITKPFNGLELLARVRAHLRRQSAGESASAVLEMGDVRVDFRRMEARRGKKDLELTPKEFAILELLVQRKGAVVSREDFLREIWKQDVAITTRTVDTQVMTLRKKIGDGERGQTARIVTVHGAGYKFTNL